MQLSALNDISGNGSWLLAGSSSHAIEPVRDLARLLEQWLARVDPVAAGEVGEVYVVAKVAAKRTVYPKAATTGLPGATHTDRPSSAAESSTYSVGVQGYPEKGDQDMADQDWLRILLEKMDQDRRDSERRVEGAIGRIENALDRLASHVESTRKEIQEQNRSLNQRIDQAYSHFQQLATQTNAAARQVLWAVIAIGVTLFLALVVRK